MMPKYINFMRNVEVNYQASTTKLCLVNSTLNIKVKRPQQLNKVRIINLI